ncbi:class I SAM-dependent methyltransferase [Roseateles terrae]|uniref:site-specific DNA-methyltransferase (adenine-specific) n=1 Tax=Roseateles terrae TaxID=431060 RepID=A0ABR6GXL8_9BURK|nr:class I SAM-dependent methyltransferase [Roseateles terrae]MBB3196849.1 methylase of polypeptide subunit release factors [Roseateles terrae]
MPAVRDTTVGRTRGLTAGPTQRTSGSTPADPLNAPNALDLEPSATAQTLLALAKALIGDAVVTEAEQQLLQTVPACEDAAQLQALTKAIRRGDDPLGALFCRLFHATTRRPEGQTFTPAPVVQGMVNWALRQGRKVTRLVDPGAGSGRYTLAGLRAFPEAEAVAVEKDPLVALLLRANLAAADLSHRAAVLVGDYRELSLAPVDGPTLFIGNPPYVRHHDISPGWKTWYAYCLTHAGLKGSQLAGLHLHFFLKTRQLAVPGDFGVFVTAAEWMDVNYGQALRDMLANGLGGTEIHVVAPELQVFEDAMVSAAITCFSPEATQADAPLRFQSIQAPAELLTLPPGREIPRETARQERKWSVLLRGGRPARQPGQMELGELFQVSRGQVTGLNRVWVHGPGAPALPEAYLVPSITDASDISAAPGQEIGPLQTLRRVVCLPRDLAPLPAAHRRAIDTFLAWAQSQGAHEGYIARHRKPWWHVHLRDPAPIVMTYMGRRPPAFAFNAAGARLINVAHGLYPRQPMSEAQLRRLVQWLNANVSIEGGRVYAGGLTKFEPSEAMRILLPRDLLA